MEETGLTSLTRKEFYSLAEHCNRYARELARHDQNRVSLKHCHEFNQWLPQIQSYDLLAPTLHNLKPARPIARWQVMTLGAVLGLVLLLSLPESLERTYRSVILYSYLFALILFYFVPERRYGTTIELIEAKVLRVVEAMLHLLQTGDLGFSEAAFFQVKENLRVAQQELRQQIDLVHRSRNF